MLYACDEDWWKKYLPEVSGSFKGELWTQDARAAKLYGLHHIASSDQPGLSKEDVIYTGNNGGYQMINLSYLFGSARIVLLGFDMKYSSDGKKHWHGDHPGELNRDCPVRTWVKKMQVLAEHLKAEGIEVINATRETALECFPRLKLEDALC